MEKKVDLRGTLMTEAVAYKTEDILKEMGHGKVSFILNSSICASYVSLVAFKLGWEMKLDYRNDCYTIMLNKELKEGQCA